ncbi:MAG: polysaccharide biosynthesis protein [Clostridiales bacterium]|nr:polysaccharide biosynthesis protein [Clostridiales bacterium]
MKKRAFLISGLVMTATALFLKTVDISYTVYISNKIGAEGMGLYQLIVSVYCLFITVSTSGISLAVTRLTTEESAKGNENTARYAMRKCVALSMLLSVTAGSVLFCSAGLIGNQWLADSRTVLSLRVLAFALPFLAVSSCFNGYFLAKRRVVKSSAAQIFEQFAGMAATILVITLFMPDSLEYACCAIVIGSVASEVLSCLFVFLLYCFEKRKVGTDQPTKRGVFKRIFAIILPVSASSYLRNGLITLENTMIPAGLKKHGASTEGSLSVFGMLKGMVMPILFFPAAFLSSFTSLLIPEISEANAVKNKRRISSIASRAFQITLLFSIVMTSIYICFSDELGLAIYHSKDCGHLLKLLAPLVPLMYLDNVVDGMLKGLGEQLSTLRTNTIDSVIRIGLIWWLIPMKGVEGYLIVLYFSNVLNSLLSISRLVKVSQIKLNVSCWILRPALCAALSSLSVSLSFRLIPHFLSQPAWFMAIEQIVATLLLYALLLPITGCFNGEDLRWFQSIFKASAGRRE